MGETVVVRLQECVPALCQRIWRFGQISCRKPDKRVQETTSTQPGRCLGRLCGTNSVLCVKKTVPHYLADPGLLSVKRHEEENLCCVNWERLWGAPWPCSVSSQPWLWRAR